MEVEVEKTAVSPVKKGSSKPYVCPLYSNIYKAELHYVKHISKWEKSISTDTSNKFIELIQLDLEIWLMMHLIFSIGIVSFGLQIKAFIS